MGEMVKFSSKIDQEVFEELKAYAAESGRTLAALLTEAVEEHLRRVRVRPAFREAAEEIMREHADLLQRLAR